MACRRPLMRVLGAAGAAFLLTLASGCSSSSPSTGGGSSAASGGAGATGGGSAKGGAPDSSATTVDIKDFAFAPMTLTVPVGAKVTWKFDDQAKHTVVADDKSFTSPAKSSGQTYSFTFPKAGTYKYICSIHEYMTGTVVVK